MDIEEVRKVLCDLADDFAERGTRLNSVRYKYNVEGHCTNAILSFEELEDKK